MAMKAKGFLYLTISEILNTLCIFYVRCTFWTSAAMRALVLRLRIHHHRHGIIINTVK